MMMSRPRRRRLRQKLQYSNRGVRPGLRRNDLRRSRNLRLNQFRNQPRPPLPVKRDPARRDVGAAEAVVEDRGVLRRPHQSRRRKRLWRSP